MLPARRHGHSTAKNTMVPIYPSIHIFTHLLYIHGRLSLNIKRQYMQENSSSIEEKAALLQVLFKEEATAAARKRNQQEI